VSETAHEHPRTWVIWVVRAALALSVLILSVGAISTIWRGQATGSFWWLLMALPQVSISLMAVLICWTVDSRPQNLGATVTTLNTFGLVFSVLLMKCLPLVIGALAILATFLSPREWIYGGTPPPRFRWLRR
jgi:hypothetical protein